MPPSILWSSAATAVFTLAFRPQASESIIYFLSLIPISGELLSPLTPLPPPSAYGLDDGKLGCARSSVLSSHSNHHRLSQHGAELSPIGHGSVYPHPHSARGGKTKGKEVVKVATCRPSTVSSQDSGSLHRWTGRDAGEETGSYYKRRKCHFPSVGQTLSSATCFSTSPIASSQPEGNLRGHLPSRMYNENWGEGLPWRLSGYESACQCKRHGFHPRSGKIPRAAEQLSPCTTTLSLCS